MEKIIIIGAGPAGLTAAYELLKDCGDQRFDVTILEASDVIGGISQTVHYKGNRMDIGGHRFFSKNQRVEDWWTNIMPTQGAPTHDDKVLGRKMPVAPGGPDPETEDRVMLVRHRVSRIYWGGKFYDYPISLKGQTLKNLGFGLTLKVGFSYLRACIRKLPETSLENFYINHFGRVLYSMFFEGYTEKVWGRPPSQIGADWGSQRVKGVSISAILKNMFAKAFKDGQKEVETSLIEEFRYPKYGPGQLWESVADDVRALGANILMGCKVEHVSLDGGCVTGVTYVKDGQRCDAVGDRYISSMPVKDLVTAMDADKVPTEELAIAQGLPYRDFVTVGLLLKKLNLENKTDIPTLGNIVPDCWIYVQDSTVKVGRIQIFNNWSPYLTENPEESVWVGLEYFCEEGDDFWNLTDQETIDLAIDELTKMDIISGKDDVLDAHRERIQKAYPAYFDTYEHMDELVDYLKGFDNLFCVGRNGQHRYNNMDHSMMTSFIAAEGIKDGAADQTALWNVNTETEYHEVANGDPEEDEEN